MENVTFVSNSHQRPAADNLQKLKSLLTNTRQQIKSQTQHSAGYHQKSLCKQFHFSLLSER